MSSAAKLRKYGRGTATVAAAALVMTSFGPAAFASWEDAPQTTVVEGQRELGTIGIVDAAKGKVPGDVTPTPTIPNISATAAEVLNGVSEDSNEAQGATLLWAGQKDQSIADVRLVIPNRFRSGDIIDLRLLDRSATEWSNGNTNANEEKSVGFTGTPKVTVDSSPKIGNVDGEGWTLKRATGDIAVPQGTQVSADTDAVGPGISNTETGAIDWEADQRYVTGSNATDTNLNINRTKPTNTPSFTVVNDADAAVQGKNNLRIRVTNEANGDPNANWVVTLSDLKVDLGANVTPGELRLVPFASSTTNGGSTYTESDWFAGNRKETRNANGSINTQREIGIYTVPAYVSPVTIDAGNLDILADGIPQAVGDITISETQNYSLGNGAYKLTINGAQATTTSGKITVTDPGTGETVTGFAVTNPTGTSVEVAFTINGADHAKLSKYVISGLVLSTSNPSTMKFTFSGGDIHGGAAAWLTPGGLSTLTRPASPGAVAIREDAYFLDEANAGETVKRSTDAAPTVTPGTPADALDGETLSGDVKMLANGTYTVSRPVTGTAVDNLAAPGVSQSALQSTDAATYTFRNAVATVTTAGAGGTAAGTTTTDSVPAGTYTMSGSSGVTTPAGVTGEYTSAGVITLSNGAKITVDGALTDADSVVIDGATRDVYKGAVKTISNSDVAAVDADLDAGGSGAAVDFASRPGDGETLVVGDLAVTTPGGVVLTISTTDTFDVNGAAAGGEVSNGDALIPGTFTVSRGLADDPEHVNQQDILPATDLTRTGIATAQSARIGGNNRYETAAKVAERWANGDKSLFNGKFANAIIASGENFPDALSAAYLSQRMNAPILLTQKGSIPQDTIEALRDRQVDKVFIIGGPAAVSTQVQDQLKALDTYYVDSDRANSPLRTTGAKLQVQRLSSANPQNDNRYTTNQLVNMYGAAWGGTKTIGKTVYKFGESSKYTAIFARGDNFPDALAAGVLTAGVLPDASSPRVVSDRALPLILTQPTQLSASAVAQIQNLDVEHGLIIGSENAISDGVKKSIEDQGVSNTRIGGADRYFTAAAVDEFAMRDNVGSAVNEYPGLGFLSPSLGDTVTTSFIANGLKFPDALSAAPWVGRNANVLNLVQPADLTDGTRDFLSKRAAAVNNVIALGLGDAVKTAVVNEANRIASGK